MSAFVSLIFGSSEPGCFIKYEPVKVHRTCRYSVDKPLYVSLMIRSNSLR